MNLVAIDTSTRWAGVGVRADSGETADMTWRSDQNHGRELMPAVVEVAGRVGLGPQDISHVCVATGPGGFSAVRVGISTALGLALPASLPVAGVPTHLLEAFPYRGSASEETRLYSLLPAGRYEVSWARFDSPGHVVTESGLCGPDEVASMLQDGDRACGEGAAVLAGMVEPGALLTGEPPTRSPSSLLEIALARFEAGQSTPLTELRPIYARPPSITMPKQRG